MGKKILDNNVTKKLDHNKIIFSIFSCRSNNIYLNIVTPYLYTEAIIRAGMNDLFSLFN